MAGAQGLGRGIESMGADLGAGIQRLMERKRNDAQLTTSLRKTLSIAYPDRKDDFAVMGKDELQGTLKGEALRAALTDEQDRRQKMQYDLSALRDEAQQREAQRALPGAILGEAQADIPSPLSNANFDTETDRRLALPPGAGNLLRGYQQAGAPLPPAILGDLLQRGAGGLDGAGPPVIDQVDLPFGNKGAVLRGSKNLQILTDPKGALPTEQIEDADGNVHTIVRNPKTGAPMLLRPPPAQKDVSQISGSDKLRALTSQLDAVHKTLPFGEAEKKKAADLSRRIDELIEGGGKGGAGAPAPAAAPNPIGSAFDAWLKKKK